MAAALTEFATNTRCNTTDGQKSCQIPRTRILTHVIDGFIIEESNTPFQFPEQPDNRTTQTEDVDKRSVDSDGLDVPMEEEDSMTSHSTSSIDDNERPVDLMYCENCGSCIGSYQKIKAYRRFCSKSCARRFSVAHARHMRGSGRGKTSIVGRPRIASPSVTKFAQSNITYQREYSHRVDVAIQVNLNVNIASVDGLSAHMKNPDEEVWKYDCLPAAKWDVAQVAEFIRSLPNCKEFVDSFIDQEIDGRALLLLKEQHMVEAMKIKLGPALKIQAHINALKAMADAENNENQHH